MICKKCNQPLPENGGGFCSHCGAKIEEEATKLSCSVCGKATEPGDRFCAFCGGEVKVMEEENLPQEGDEGKEKEKIGKSYIVTVLSTIISFLIRVTQQAEQRIYISSFDFRYALGLDKDLKPFYSLIPVAAGIIALLIVNSDKKASSQRKTKALLINAIYLILSIIFIWLDLPKKLFDF